MNSNTQPLLTQAQTAIAESNWAEAIECLQDVLLGRQSPLTEAILDDVLRLALVILKSGDFQNRWDIAKLIPELGDHAIAPLIAELHNATAELEVRWFAARILGDLPHPDSLKALIQTIQLSSHDDLCGIAAVSLVNYGAKVIGAIAELLAAPETRRWAVQILSRIHHSDTIPLLLQAINDAQADIRASAIEALTNFHHPHITEVLLQALADPAAPVRAVAVTGLGVQANLSSATNYVEQIKPLLQDLNLQVGEQAAIALGRLGTDSATVALAEVLRSPYTPEPLKITILQTLGWMESRSAIMVVQHYLTQQTADPESWQVIQASINALNQVKTTALKPQVAQFLITLLQTRHPVTQLVAARQLLALGLGQLGEAIALDPLIQLLADADTTVQLHAIAALKHLDSQTAHHRLMELAQTGGLKADLSKGLAIALQEW